MAKCAIALAPGGETRMKATIKPLITGIAIAVLLFGIGSSRKAQADLPAANLLNGIANVANSLSMRDAQQGKLQQAAIWRGWADFYRGYVPQCPPNLPASRLATMNANGLPQLAAAADARGLTAYARLCRASAAMWQDMANQIVRGGEVIVLFPDEFLVVIPGAPLTPWANLRAAAPAQQAQRPAPPA